ncbi:MAG TPA: NFACT RNA binding domain-containing protein [Pyrinomonadaceae bacterium]|nr:NFACT RNA binding domain-containing protein [Pyrinomonadaceae bacterium]
MHQETLREVVAELGQLLPGHFIGKIYQNSAFSLAIDFGLNRDGLLLVSVDPEAPRLYLIKRGLRALEKSAKPHSLFVQTMRAAIAGGVVESVTKDEDERVVRIELNVTDDLGDLHRRILVAQLTGRSANLFLLDQDQKITHVLRPPVGDSQMVGAIYCPPAQSKTIVEGTRILRGKFPTTSAAVDDHYNHLELAQAFEVRIARLIANQKKELARLKKLKANLQKDLVAHGHPETHKRLGDLFIANIASAERNGDKVTLTDYWAEGSPTLEVDLEANTSLQDAAATAFSRYAKSKRAIEEIGTRLTQVDTQIIELEKQQARLQEAIATGDEGRLSEFEASGGKKSAPRKKKQEAQGLPGMRRYLSSDGYEVITGRSARDNDRLTFREARPNDLWLHAGDYPGSHVIVRNSSRKEIPHRTIVEAAQLAAKFSQASKDAKVNIHYTQRKFLSKPKGAAPGLVRLSSFKSITVEPGENIERI